MSPVGAPQAEEPAGMLGDRKDRRKRRLMCLHAETVTLSPVVPPPSGSCRRVEPESSEQEGPNENRAFSCCLLVEQKITIKKLMT